MAKSEDVSSIADASRPNSGRIYDYFLGGSHNFEIDRQAAEQLLQLAPFIPEMARLVRWFLGEATTRLSAEGFTKYIDFASGLPTQDHIHQVAPKGSKVIYSDIDPITVAYAQEILKDKPDTRYVHCDAGKPEELLNSDTVNELFGDDRKVAIGFNGIAYFLTNEQFKHAMEATYKWAAKGSKLFITDVNLDDPSEMIQQVIQIYRNMGQPCDVRPLEQMLSFAKPWRVVDPGPLTLERWYGLEERLSKVEIEAMGGDLYGVILEK
jgi:hypothetical protein